MFLNSAIGFLLTILIFQDGFAPKIYGNRNAFLTDAFSVPQQKLAISKRARRKHSSARQQQRQRNTDTFVSIRDTETIVLQAAIPFYASDVERNQEEKNASPPFVIESISRRPGPGEAIYKDIADLCIDVFFKELLDPSGKGNVNLLKTWQINYLKNLQAADLERRRRRCPDTNEMFLAYEVRETKGTSEALTQPLLMDDELEKAYNLKSKSSGDKAFDSSRSYVRGDLIGFVEITQRSYGLGNSVEGTSLFSSEFQKRPVLTNLAVIKESRKYGIGSKLLDRCEEHVVKEWNMKEVILEVEDYNGKGLEFYQKRGYEVLFSDPASRRYDIQGFWLNKVRCRRDIMRKGLETTPATQLIKSADNLLRKFVDSVGSF